jgi:RHS repeat-associated protein
LKEVLTPEGYWQNGLYYYYLKDHQGNNRVVINPSGTVMEYSDYYPDGMRFWTSTSNSAALPYRYNGKELEAMNGLNEYDYGARRRETGIPVWTTVDPLAEEMPGITPYHYCYDNPISYIDPDGQFSSPFSAWIYKLFHGGGETHKDAKTGEYFVSNQSSSKTASGEVVIISTRRFDWHGRNSGEKQYDQTYGQTMTGGNGSGLESTAQFHGNQIDLSPFSYPFGGTNNAMIGQFAYDLAGKVAALMTMNMGNQIVSFAEQNNQQNKVEEKIIDASIVIKVFGGGVGMSPYVYFKSRRRGVNYFNAPGWRVTDTVFTESVRNTYDNNGRLTNTDTTITTFNH